MTNAIAVLPNVAPLALNHQALVLVLAAHAIDGVVLVPGSHLRLVQKVNSTGETQDFAKRSVVLRLDGVVHLPELESCFALLRVVAKVSKVVLEESEQVSIELFGRVVVAGVDVAIDLEKVDRLRDERRVERMVLLGGNRVEKSRD